MTYETLTAADREAMLETIGVSSIEELFRDIPAGVRFDRPLELGDPLTEQEIVERLEELAARNVHAGEELSFVGAGVYDHYVPAVVDYILSRGEFLTAYTPYQPEMSQGVLQAIFEYQTVICELTGMDVSNASGYDGTTVAADACYIAKHATGRKKIVLAETINPQVRQVVRTYAPGFGMEVVDVPHRDGVIDPEEYRAAAEDAACAIFQQPNFFGCLEPAPELAAAANDAEALAVAHVDPMSLGVLEAPGNYGCAIAIGEGQSAGNPLSYGGPHYGFVAAREEFTRRMPGRIVGETTDVEGRRGYVLTLQTREQHIRREKATSNITTNQTLLALGGLIYLCWLGPEGLREVGETCMALAEHAKERLDLPLLFPEQATFKEFGVRVGRQAQQAIREARTHGLIYLCWLGPEGLREVGETCMALAEHAKERLDLPLLFPEQATFKEFGVRVGRQAQQAIREARTHGLNPGYPVGRDYPGMDDALLVAVTERRTLDDIERLADALVE